MDEVKNFKPSHMINTLKDEYGEPYFYSEELDELVARGITNVLRLFQDGKGNDDRRARRVQKLLGRIEKGSNSRSYRLDEIYARCEPKPSTETFTPPHTSTVSHVREVNPWNPRGDGHLPRRARGELCAVASGTFVDALAGDNEVFDNHHRSGGYDHDDWRLDKFS